ncbi:hypothetical protein [uncultured Microbacterium sp.]|uniref:hypothetical protein n=1 Tax=uncultured Microbacterium sp. TaxID=191216 RepID=UPI0028E65A41|nr:hypothetical protein [uncultured Microbacterium sp.]
MSRQWVPADYPSKKRLSEAEALEALDHGPKPEWLEPWIERGVMLANLTKHGYGYVHVYSVAGSFQYDFAAWPDQEGLNWGLDALWQHHSKQSPLGDRSYPRCEECQGIVYFTPDQPVRLHLVVEQDDLDDDGEVGP